MFSILRNRPLLLFAFSFFSPLFALSIIARTIPKIAIVSPVSNLYLLCLSSLGLCIFYGISSLPMEAIGCLAARNLRIVICRVVSIVSLYGITFGFWSNRSDLSLDQLPDLCIQHIYTIRFGAFHWKGEQKDEKKDEFCKDNRKPENLSPKKKAELRQRMIKWRL